MLCLRNNSHSAVLIVFKSSFFFLVPYFFKGDQMSLPLAIFKRVETAFTVLHNKTLGTRLSLNICETKSRFFVTLIVQRNVVN